MKSPSGVGYHLEEPQVVEFFENFWSDPEDRLLPPDRKHGVNPVGDIRVEKNRSSVDVFRRLVYSTKQIDEFLSSKPLAESWSPADLGYKIISNLDRNNLPTKIDKNKVRYYATKKSRD